jgi:uncharacterized FlaG/YvyC family protein
MQVLLNTSQITEASTERTVAKPVRQSAATPAPAKPATSENSKPQVPAGILQANVTFRRDAAGQIYYVVSDAETGKELREVPPEELRKVGQGIEEFLKQEQQKAAQSQSLEVKA